MKQEDDGSVAEEVERFREKLEELEREQRAALEVMRWQLGDIEKRLRVPKAGAPMEVSTPWIGKETEAVRIPEREPEPEPSAPTLAPPPLPVPPAKKGPSEMEFGSVWLARFGVIILLTGLVLAGNYAYHNWIHQLRPGLKLLALFVCAGGLIETGRRLAARTTMKRPGEVIFAGGLSFFYYCTFAAHHVGQLKVIESPVLAGLLLLLAAALIVGAAWLQNSRTIAVLGIVFASYSTMLQPIGWLSCVSNVVLAGAGLLLMLRPGWSGPGIASMAGSYGAFLGWQLLGAAQGDPRDPAVLWFLPPVWLMYSLPGLLGRFRETMSGRARAWFTGGNNAAFFLLFSGLWIGRFHSGDYWAVCAIFGLLLLGFGVLGRWRGEIAGGVNISQGLLLTSIALVLKLDGWHLELALAAESLALAFSFRRFRGRSELVFTLLTALWAVGLTLGYLYPFYWFVDKTQLVIWTAGVTALLVAGASVVLQREVAGEDEELRKGARVASRVIFFTAVLGGLVGWGLRLPEPWKLPVLVGVSTALSAASLLVDRQRKMPEIASGAMIFLMSGSVIGFWAQELWAITVAGAFALAGSWLWHSGERMRRPAAVAPRDVGVYAWAFSAVAVAATWLAFIRADLGMQALTLSLGIAGIVLVCMGVWGRCSRLAACASLLNAAGLYRAVVYSSDWKYPALISAVLALATVQLIWFAKSRKLLSESKWTVSTSVLRLTAFVGFCLFWEKVSHTSFGDGVCLMVIAMTAFALIRKKPLLVEVWGFLMVVFVWLVLAILFDPWWLIENPSWRGGVVVFSMLLLMGGSLLKRDAQESQAVRGIFGAMTCFTVALWASEMLVWRANWQPLSVLWSLLGFAFVSSGLWMRLKIFRRAGFVLLAAAVIKVFTVDVWEFRAFMRVVSFIVLGAALILLGLFYNRFTGVVKQLLDDEKESR